MNSERNRAGRAGFFCKEQFAAPLSSIVSRLFGKACTPCTNQPGGMTFNATRRAVEEAGEVGERRARPAHLMHSSESWCTLNFAGLSWWDMRLHALQLPEADGEE
jgi:hypothetical protein